MPPTPRDAPLRAALATCALVVWVGGFEVGPALHVGLHGRIAAHDHLGGGHTHADAPADAPADAHRFDHVARWRASLEALFAPRGAGAKAPSTRARLVVGDGSPLRHGLHAAAHRHLAARPPAAGLPALLPAPLVGLVPRPARPDAFDDAPATAPCARGPPTIG